MSFDHTNNPSAFERRRQSDPPDATGTGPRPRLVHGPDIEMSGTGLAASNSLLRIAGNADFDSSVDTSINDNTNSFNTTNVSYWNGEGIAGPALPNESPSGYDQRTRMLQSLSSSVVIADSHPTVDGYTSEESCQWFLRSDDFSAWLKQTGDRFLWIKGKPGAGKSTLINRARQHTRSLLQENDQEKFVILSFSFCAQGSTEQISIASLFRAMLLQLLGARPHLAPRISWDMSATWNQHSLYQALRDVLSGMKNESVFCFFDDVERCKDVQNRNALWQLKSLDEVTLPNNTRLQFCFASRYFPAIPTPKHGFRTLSLSDQQGHKDEFASCADRFLELGRQPDNTRTEAGENLKNDIITFSSGSFTSLVTSINRRNRELATGRINSTDTFTSMHRNIPLDMEALFKSMLPEEDADTTVFCCCLVWVMFSSWVIRVAPGRLTFRDLYFAIMTALEPLKLSTNHAKQTPEDHMKSYILEASRGFVEMKGEDGASDAKDVVCIHAQVNSFFLRDDGKELRKLLVRSQFATAYPKLNQIHDLHGQLAIWCKDFLASDIVTDFIVHGTEELPPFLLYALESTFRLANRGVSMHDFLATFPLQRWLELNQCVRRRIVTIRLSPFEPDTELSLILASHGATNLIRAQTGAKSCFSVYKPYRTLQVPIIIAIRVRRNDLAAALLEVHIREMLPASYYQELVRGFTITEELQKHFQQPILDEEDLMKLMVCCPSAALLELYVANRKEVNINRHLTRYNERTMLSLAAERGTAETVRVLVEENASVDAPDDQRQPPFYWALKNPDSVPIVRLILDRGPLLQPKDPFRKALLDHAVEKKDVRIEIIEMLVDQKGIRVDRLSGGRLKIVRHHTPLCFAIANKRLDIAKVLIAAGAKVTLEGHPPHHAKRLASHYCVVRKPNDSRFPGSPGWRGRRIRRWEARNKHRIGRGRSISSVIDEVDMSDEEDDLLEDGPDESAEILALYDGSDGNGSADGGDDDVTEGSQSGRCDTPLYDDDDARDEQDGGDDSWDEIASNASLSDA